VTAQPAVHANAVPAIPAEVKPDFDYLQSNAKFTPTEGKKLPVASLSNSRMGIVGIAHDTVSYTSMFRGGLGLK
jgi:hypothetical protein